MSRLIQSINYSITSNCDRMCPHCCMNLLEKEPWEASWDYIVDSAKYFKGIRRIHLTGGEPTLHSQFCEIVPKLKKLFQCGILTLESNGWGFQKFPEIFKEFDVIQVSHYMKNSYIGSWDNTDDVEFIKSFLKETNTIVLVGDIIHIDRNVRNNGLICDRGTSETVAYYDSKLFPCCVGPGLKDSPSITLSDKWEKEIRDIDIPCNTCWFSL